MKHLHVFGVGQLIVLVLLAMLTVGPDNIYSQDDRTIASLDVADKVDVAGFLNEVVAGSNEDFMEVRHLRASGTNQEIGFQLGQIAQRHGWRPNETADRYKTEAQIAYFKKYWPYQVERMRGIAEASNKSIEQNEYNFASLGYQEIDGGCSCFYLPPGVSDREGGLFSRNFDFTTGPMNRQPRTASNPIACSRPYVVELYPDSGYATLAVVCFDLMGVVDGINSEGLTIALLADDEIMRDSHHPSPGPRAGFGVVELPRYILETCANVEEAKQKLYEAKLYYGSIPCHYLIADAAGNSFVWENTAGMNDGVAIDGNGKPQITTNFMLHLHPETSELPTESHPQGYFNRYRRLASELKPNQVYNEADVIEFASCVAANVATGAGSVPNRTLWHSLYDLEQRSMKVSFYLGEGTGTANADNDKTKTAANRRTEYLTFRLQ